MSRRAELQSEIQRERSRLDGLVREATEAQARLDDLQRQFDKEVTSGHSPGFISPAPNIPPPTTNAAKVALFRFLFRGREDVFPRRWENPRKGTAGYSPACRNDWDWNLCDKRKGSKPGRASVCGGCPNQAFIPVSDDEVAGHLRGDHVMGLYPLLAGETCWLLAADFDKGAWQDDILAFAETCDRHRIPVALERSRSGNGAHAWFFLDAPVPASVARRFGCFLLTETMSSRHQLSMESYDRLFPNQDTMPKGGFGNLIALPLQREAREAGNTLFVDRSLRPWSDQWAYLAGLSRTPASRVHQIADDAARRGAVLAVAALDSEEDKGTQTPWNRPPSGRRPAIVAISEPLPAVIRGVLAQRLFIEVAGLPSSVLGQLKRLAAFPNPEFYKKQNLRLSTALTPRVIGCAEDLRDHVALPRGCHDEAKDLLKELGTTLEVADERETGQPTVFEFHGALTAVQHQAVEALLAHETGVFVAPPGIGKTVVGIFLTAARKTSTLILVHRKPLVDQWIGQLSSFFGIEPKAVGQIGAGKSKPNGRLDVAMVQSLVRRDGVSELIAGYGQVILDEAHHCPAVSFERVLGEVKARFVVGLTATPQRRDGHHPILRMQLGPVRLAVGMRDSGAERPFTRRLLIRDTAFTSSGTADGQTIQELYASLAADPQRNDLIFDDVVRALEDRRSPIVLTERRDHLEHFAERLRSFTRNLIVLHGGMKPKDRRTALAQLASLPATEERLVLATGRYIGEGFDDARLDTLFLALPVSWKGTLIQYTGRLHRLHPGKTEVRIYDYVDRAVPMLLRMFERRMRGYRAIGYSARTEDDKTKALAPEDGLVYHR